MKAKQVLTYVVSLGIGVVLFYGAFSFIDDKEVLWETMRSARWEGIAASFVMGYLAIVSRGLRWGILRCGAIRMLRERWSAIRS